MSTIRFLSTKEIAQSLEMKEVIAAVEAVYADKSKGQTEVWPTVFHVFEEGKADLDIKSGQLKNRNLYGHKTVSWFGDNESKGLPGLFGLIVFYDATTGAPQGVFDATYITGMRTGAAAALGAKHLARDNSENLLVIGAGNQAIFQIAAMISAFPFLKCIRLFDRAIDKAEAFLVNLPARLKKEFGLESGALKFEAVKSLSVAVGASDIIITVTPSRKPIVKRDWVRAGTHISCIGADMEGKQELESELLAQARIFVDDRPHCIQVGEVEIPLKQKIIGEDAIVGELGDLIVGAITGRENKNQITVFDATGIALLDIATAEVALKKAELRGLGTEVEL